MRTPIEVDGARILGLTGDDDPWTHGGGVIFTNEHGAWWQFWDPPSGPNYIVHTAPVHSNVIREASYTDLDEVEQLTGIAPDELKRMSRSALDTERASLVEILRETYGASAVSPDEPERLTAWELMQRWGAAYGIDASTAPRFSMEDYLIIKTPDGYACGTVAGTALDVWNDHKDALIAIGRHKSQVGSRAHTFWVKDDGVERVDFNASLWALQVPRQERPHRRPNKPAWLRLTRSYRLEAKRKAKRSRAKTARRKYAVDARRRDIIARTRGSRSG
jgi:hypothetical protein